ncbi:uncharacterized protein APUU_31396A [Aspergillus puulaauensis]|uniref:Uncharacterized protein n=1 Tax=Aspergillus puulaauensis TaxID=1220207 RepID=A0A7R8ALD1_9EURO|nr:uncharacterized protein APUU_31396A [Aspergillus puulaauensis]BCS23171.1 hypothetical protein APUU_31396A [Aspergillus puulaauensis]
MIFECSRGSAHPTIYRDDITNMAITTGQWAPGGLESLWSTSIVIYSPASLVARGLAVGMAAAVIPNMPAFSSQEHMNIPNQALQLTELPRRWKRMGRYDRACARWCSKLASLLRSLDEEIQNTSSGL